MLIGLVGKPSAGKSSMFRALTQNAVECENYPFTTIEPNRGAGYIRVKRVDKELGVIANPRSGYLRGDYRFVPVEILDVAGLVPGAHEGKGLGNKFLNDLRDANALIHVVDASGSTNEKGEPVEVGSHNPCKDVEFLEYELNMWFYSVLIKNWPKVAKTQRSAKKKLILALREIVSGLSVKEKHLDKVIKGYPEFMTDWNAEQIKEFACRIREESKPILICANKCDSKVAYDNILKMKEKYPKRIIIPCSALSEIALRDADKSAVIDYEQGSDSFDIVESISEKQKSALEFVKTNVLDKYGSTGVQSAIDSTIYDILEKIAIFPGGVNKLGDKDGNILPDCFLLDKDSRAIDFAYHIHSDLGDKFIKAILVRNKQMVGKEHILKHRDIVEIVNGR